MSVPTEAGLAEELTRAMKTRDMPRVYVLRGLLTAIKNLKVEKKGASPTEAEIVQLVRREIRKRDEAESFAARAGRQDVVEQNRAERAMLEAFVPAQLDAARLEEAIRAIAAHPEARTMGAVMGALREQFAGRFDGKQASEIARRVLAEPPRA
ncbi:MAG TPA: GatB/YqeY domain-containing protein [Candidatus Binatia bacterium]|nr:GatB/YqeY domain-containing protein [Candidatus Binatia bacterium]